MVVSIAALALSVVSLWSATRSKEPLLVRGRAAASTTSYDRLRADLVSRLADASTCLSARIYHDDLYPLESNCQINIKGLAEFFRAYAPFVARTPYSGAESSENFAQWTEATTEDVNATRNQTELIDFQRRTGINIAQLGYYICGFEWYIRAAPPHPMSPMDQTRVSLYQSAWEDWNRSTQIEFSRVPFLRESSGQISDPECQSFIDVLD